jgi:tetratricopeptide (TPR) repeat protein
LEDKPELPSPTEAQAELNSHAAFNGSNGSLSCPELGNGQSRSEQANSAGFGEPTPSQSGISYCLNPHCTNRQNPNHLDYCQACGTLLLINSQQRTSSETNEPESLEVEDGSPNRRVGEFLLASYTSQPDNDEPNPGSDSCGWHNFINFIKPGVPLLLSVGVLGSGLALSWLFNWYGVTNHLADELSKAQFGYDWALKFNPTSAAAHYGKGAIYEDLGKHDYKKAHDEYTQACLGGSIEACNNKARLYNLQKNYDEAVSLLNKYLHQAKDDDEKHTILKNIGWARKGQGRLDEAKRDLEKAIQLNKREAVPHCLLAQVLEGKNDKKGALVEWELCNDYAYRSKLPEEDKLFHLAEQRLDAEGSQK